MKKIVNVIGGGLAGCECAYQLAKRGIEVNLYDMKPKKTEAHKMDTLAELVCSNSLKSNDLLTAGGLLKEELRHLDSMLIRTADETKVPAGASLSVDRVLFSNTITQTLQNMANVHIIYKEIESIDISQPTIIATGPLTSEALAKNIMKLIGSDELYFFDAIAPIVSYDSIDFNIAYVKDRYDKGNGDYINCPFTKDEYLRFYNELINGEIVQLKDFEKNRVYEGCMPIEVLAKRGEDSIRFGPMKPVGLQDPRSGKTPYAVVQLRKESFVNDFYNIVGFQTNLTFPEQKRIFRMIPGLENAEFQRLGTMHKNIYIKSPGILNENYQMINYPNIFFAGQITGVEGYVESISSGMVAGINMYRYLNNLSPIVFDKRTIIGALCKYIAYKTGDFQPMSANMGLINYDNLKIKDKKEKYKVLSDQSLSLIDEMIAKENI